MNCGQNNSDRRWAMGVNGQRSKWTIVGTAFFRHRTLIEETRCPNKCCLKFLALLKSPSEGTLTQLPPENALLQGERCAEFL